MKTIVVSDLHLGPDPVPPIYAGGAALPALLTGAGADRVILNGDTFDLLLDDEPLRLDAATAAARVRACTESRDGGALVRALADVLRAGGHLLIRAGNHDLEIALPEVQNELRAVFGDLGAPTGRIDFAMDDQPYVLIEDGLRVLVAHGEAQDPFNRWTRAQLASGDAYPPGSRLVKEILNPLKKHMRFLDLLKPDFQGAVLSALAVRPGDVRAILKTATIDIIAEAVARSFGEAPYAGLDANPFSLHLDGADLDPDEGDELLAFLDEAGPASFTDAQANPTPGLLQRALSKVGRAALRTYAALHRRITGAAGQEFFDETPSESEWTEAERVAAKFGVDVVVLGHTHARRFGRRNRITYANTGTWIALLELPAQDAPVAEWTSFLEELRADPHLAQSPRVRLLGTACVIDPGDAAEPVRLVRVDQAPDAAWFRSQGS